MVDGIYLCSTRINFDSSYLAMPREYDSLYNCILALSRQLAGTVGLINVVLPSFLHMFFWSFLAHGILTCVFGPKGNKVLKSYDLIYVLFFSSLYHLQVWSYPEPYVVATLHSWFIIFSPFPLNIFQDGPVCWKESGGICDSVNSKNQPWTVCWPCFCVHDCFWYLDVIFIAYFIKMIE